MTASDNRINSNKNNASTIKSKSASINRNSSPQSTVSKTSVGTSGGFSKGMVIKGEIIDLRDKDVKIQLDDSRIIQAKMDDSQNVSIGDKASFQITSAGLNSMSLKMLSKSYALSQEHMLEKALDEAGLPHTDRNLTAVKELLNNQLPINKTAIQTLLKQAVIYKNASLETLALMNKLNMPMNEVTTSQFEAYKNYEHRILSQLESFTNSILSNDLFKESAILLINILQDKDMQGESIMTDNFNEAASNNIDLLENEHTFKNSQNLAPLNTILTQEERLNLTELLDSFGLNDINQSGLISGNISIREAAHIILDTSKALGENESIIETNHLEYFDNAVNDSSATGLKQETTVSLNIINNELLDTLLEALKKPEVYTLLESFISNSTNNLELSSFLSSSEREQLLELIKPLGLSNEFIDLVKNGDISAKEMLFVFDKLINEEDESINSLFSNKAFKSVMRELLMSRWTLTPSELAKPDSLEKYYRRLDEDLKSLEKREHDYLSGESNTFNSSSNRHNSSASDLRDNIDFMKTLNQMFTYCQMPLKLSGGNVHSELYVYTNKKTLLNNKDQIKVLLHLDMTHLGSLDIHVELINKAIATKFYIEQDDSAPIISENINQLTKSLENKGFTHISEILKRNKEIDIVEDFIAPKEIGLDMKRYTFDRRA